jgi:ABC-2 type transport system ATP-binding protein
MIRVQSVYKNYGHRAAITDLNFEIQKGEIVGFLGPNGAGKTTTMKMLTGFMTPSQGKIEIAGFDVAKNPIEVKKKLGYLPETPPVYFDMTVHSYLAYVADLKKVPAVEKKKNIESVLDSLKLFDVKDRLIQNLSKGFRQRVGIAQALVSNPEVLVLDEPTVGLDPQQVAEFRDILKKLKGNHTIILSTHILQEVQASCERVIIINKGQIVAQNTIEALTEIVQNSEFKSGRDNQVKVYLKVSRPSEEFKKLLGTESYIKSVRLQGSQYEIECDNQEEHFESILKNVMDKKVGFQEFRKEHLLLEDVFVQLTQSQPLSKANSMTKNKPQSVEDGVSK